MAGRVPRRLPVARRPGERCLSYVMRLALVGGLVAGCGDGRAPGPAAGSGAPAAAVADDTGATSLARAAGGRDGRAYTVRAAANPGVLVGHVGGGTPRDTSIVPTHDRAVCRPFTESLVPSRDGGVGNAVVWLVGVATGPRDTTSRRVRLSLDGCRLEPRVQRVAVGSTILMSGRDAMLSRLQFVAMDEATPRATVLLSDAGQLVPTSDPTASPALMQVRDDLHPWVRGWLAVAPHPFVAVTDADGGFRFEGVPPGRYRLVVWHEALGITRTSIRIDAGIETRVDVAY
ncbi:MAG: carboxypeptidase-like regulatory domain-containing protein [Gemmatimonas sp.]|jgi:hypothetical protein|uniref:carboxypeptidase-like regulatory domain-containing protein n=1 Tax=Gemmatimonas sp. TaxID=1962908 RepID=UPI00391F6A2F|nr:carboxypeptidase-like regulatory domain-containing protein [Gemmatimonadota bacterium]